MRPVRCRSGSRRAWFGPVFRTPPPPKRAFRFGGRGPRGGGGGAGATPAAGESNPTADAIAARRARSVTVSLHFNLYSIEHVHLSAVARLPAPLPPYRDRLARARVGGNGDDGGDPGAGRGGRGRDQHPGPLGASAARPRDLRGGAVGGPGYGGAAG